MHMLTYMPSMLRGVRTVSWELVPQGCMSA